MFFETLTRFYGIDWLASSLSVLMIYFLGNKNRIGFFFGISANLSWLVFAVIVSSPPIFISNAVFLILNSRGIRKWKNPLQPLVPTTGELS